MSHVIGCVALDVAQTDEASTQHPDPAPTLCAVHHASIEYSGSVIAASVNAPGSRCRVSVSAVAAAAVPLPAGYGWTAYDGNQPVVLPSPTDAAHQAYRPGKRGRRAAHDTTPTRGKQAIRTGS
jgi:hypothetical protein